MVGMDYCVECVPAVRCSCGINQQYILVVIQSRGVQSLVLVSVYANTRVDEQINLWKKLEKLYSIECWCRTFMLYK